MKIALIAPPWKKLPSGEYTGIEATIYNLAEKLTELNHDVLLFAPAGSKSKAKVIEYPKNSSDLDFQKLTFNTRYYLKKIIATYASNRAVLMGAEVIHDFTLAGFFENKVPALHTVFGPPRAEIINLCKELAKLNNNYLVGVSKRQKTLFNDAGPNINFIDSVYKSIDLDKFELTDEKKDYFLFIAQSDQKKNLELVKKVTDKTKKRLMAILYSDKDNNLSKDIGSWINNNDKNLNLELTEELDPQTRGKLYSRAKATFYIGNWDDPLGMEMLESIACGTPVIALNKGAAREIIKDGKNGYLTETEAEMIEAVKNIDKISPEDCRKTAAENFSSDIIAKKYLDIYKKILKVS